MKALRVFYNQNNEIIWTHGLEGNGVFPTLPEDDLKDLPSETKCVTLTDPTEIDTFMASDTNKIVDGKLVFGEPRPIPEPTPPEPSELEKLKARVKALEDAQI